MRAFKNGFVMAMLLLPPAVAMAADNDPAPSSRETLAAACDASLTVCHDACMRPSGSVSGQIEQGFCEDDCERTNVTCLRSIPAKQQRKNTLSRPTTGKGAAQTHQ